MLPRKVQSLVRSHPGKGGTARVEASFWSVLASFWVSPFNPIPSLARGMATRVVTATWGDPAGSCLLSFCGLYQFCLSFTSPTELLCVPLAVEYIQTLAFVFLFLEQSTSFGLGKTEGVSILACESSEG